MKKSVFITLIIIFAFMSGAAFIASMPGLIIFGPDFGKVAVCSDINNYAVADAEIKEVDINEHGISYIVLSGAPEKKYVFAVDNAAVAQSGLNDVLEAGISVKITSIAAPPPETYYIAALSFNDKDYIDFEQSKDIIVNVYKRSNKKGTIWLSITGSIMLVGIIGFVTVFIVYKKSKIKAVKNA